jgi:futalosine hydrolase
MKCLLVAATAKEISPFIEHINISDKSFYIDFELDVLITGVGLTASTYSLTRHLALKKPDLVVQAGIAGSFTKALKLGSVVAIKKETIADLGVMEKKIWQDSFDLKLSNPNSFPFKKAALINPYVTLLKRVRLKSVNAVTVNQITTATKTAETYVEKYKAAVESMEGAALHYVCLMENVPFLQLRAISNYSGERDKKKWKIKESVQQLNNELIRLVESL